LIAPFHKVGLLYVYCTENRVESQYLICVYFYFCPKKAKKDRESLGKTGLGRFVGKFSKIFKKPIDKQNRPVYNTDIAGENKQKS